jgi:hypothetical protein
VKPIEIIAQGISSVEASRANIKLTLEPQPNPEEKCFVNHKQVHWRQEYSVAGNILQIVPGITLIDKQFPTRR